MNNTCPQCGCHRLLGVHALSCYPYPRLTPQEARDWEIRIAKLEAELAEEAPEMLKRRRALSEWYTLAV
jgi:hypothetical protein